MHHTPLSSLLLWKTLLLFLCCPAIANDSLIEVTNISAEMSGQKVDPDTLTHSPLQYYDGDTELEGFVAHPKDPSEKLPVVLIVHQWMGLGSYEKARACQLAHNGYLAICLDIYGKGIRPSDKPTAGKTSGTYKNDRQLFRQRLLAGLEAASKHPHADTSKIAAIGYCFGGTGVLELTRAGADVAGVISFHGGLGTPTPEDAKNIQSKILVCHGADDPLVPDTELRAFESEMRAHQIDWQLISYGGAVHAFTQPMAGSDPSKGVAYDKKADHRSFTAMLSFLKEIF